MERIKTDIEEPIPEIGEFVMENSSNLIVIQHEELRLKIFLHSLLVKYRTGFKEYYREYRKTKKIAHFASAGTSEEWIEKRRATLQKRPTEAT